MQIKCFMFNMRNLLIFVILITPKIYASDQIPMSWSKLEPVLTSLLTQNNLKMKLSTSQVKSFKSFLKKIGKNVPMLEQLQNILPRTTVELLMAVKERGLSLYEAEKMAGYLELLVKKYKFQNLHQFDENTSHIIGREWNEINYSGENMTWKQQKLNYLPYGITNFKTEENLKKFFEVESKVPYFKKIYRPFRKKELTRPKHG